MKLRIIREVVIGASFIAITASFSAAQDVAHRFAAMGTDIMCDSYVPLVVRENCDPSYRPEYRAIAVSAGQIIALMDQARSEGHNYSRIASQMRDIADERFISPSPNHLPKYATIDRQKLCSMPPVQVQKECRTLLNRETDGLIRETDRLSAVHKAMMAAPPKTKEEDEAETADLLSKSCSIMASSMKKGCATSEGKGMAYKIWMSETERVLQDRRFGLVGAQAMMLSMNAFFGMSCSTPDPLAECMSSVSKKEQPRSPF